MSPLLSTYEKSLTIGLILGYSSAKRALSSRPVWWSVATASGSFGVVMNSRPSSVSTSAQSLMKRSCTPWSMCSSTSHANAYLNFFLPAYRLRGAWTYSTLAAALYLRQNAMAFLSLSRPTILLFGNTVASSSVVFPEPQPMSSMSPSSAQNSSMNES